MRLLIVSLSLFLAAPLAAESLSIAKLARNESIILVYSRTDGPRYIERLYEIKVNGPATYFGAVERQNKVNGKRVNAEVNRTIGTTYLTSTESFGLDAYLLYLRHGYPGTCSMTDLFTIGYYRDGKQIGEERFSDATCRTANFRLEEDKVIADEKTIPADFPAALYRAMIPPRLIEDRIAQEAAATASAAKP